MIQQLSLLPLRIKHLAPSTYGGAELRYIARTHDGDDYAIKGLPGDSIGVAASETIGYHLARCCQLSVPHYGVLQTEEGHMVFGCRIDPLAKSATHLQAFEVVGSLRECADQVSIMLALDLFIGNVDRHKDNYLFRRNLSGEWMLVLIDFSRALFAKGFPDDPFPQPEGTNTRTTITVVKGLGAWNQGMAIFALSQLQEITANMLGGWIAAMPEGWLDDQATKEILAWWGSPAYHTRLQQTIAQL